MTITATAFLTVTQLNRQVRLWLEQDLGLIHVEGEISNLSKPSSGHFYFSLKDAASQIRCVFFRNRQSAAHGSLKNGQQVLISGNLSLYEARGDYQLVVYTLEEAGQGALFKQFEALKSKLAALGLFDTQRKRALPSFPQTIGVITSPSGAAIRDILTTLQRRFSLAKVIIYPSEVQGKQAPQQLIQALTQANQEKRCDVLILARGGGSLEDLWAFNDEHLAYAIAKSDIPIVSGVGHETDFTIADFVADLRAATPTAAAEAVTPNLVDLMTQLKTLETMLCRTMNRYLQHHQLRLQCEIQKISSPKYLISNYWQTLDRLKTQLLHGVKGQVQQKKLGLQTLQSQLNQYNPTTRLQAVHLQLYQLQALLKQGITAKITQKKQILMQLGATLHGVSPLATLDRGYALVSFQSQIVRSAAQVKCGDRLSIQLKEGIIHSEVL